MMENTTPLKGIRVLEFAGLAPGPMAGMMLADWGSSVLRVDRASSASDFPTGDLLTRHKSSITVDLKSSAGIDLIKDLVRRVDVVIDPFRPGVLEKLGLDPKKILMAINPRLIVARMTGFRRDGKYSQMAGHDINYIAVSGVLGMLGAANANPEPPGNLLGDFAGGGTMCFLGIVLALYARVSSGRGQVVEANMVDGAAYIATSPRLATKTPLWNGPRGTNLLDGGCPYYGTYETQDGKYVSVGALEPQFFAALLKGLDLDNTDLPGKRDDRSKWPDLRVLFKEKFKSKTRQEWENIFDGTDACVAPVLSQLELELSGYEQRAAVTLKGTPSLAIAQNVNEGNESISGQGPGVAGGGWVSTGLTPGTGGEDILDQWVGWKRGRDYEIGEHGYFKCSILKL